MRILRRDFTRLGGECENNMETPATSSDEMDSTHWRREPIDDPYALPKDKNECISCGHLLQKVRTYPAICGMCQVSDPRADISADRSLERIEDHYKQTPSWAK